MTKASAQITLFNINEIITSPTAPLSPSEKQVWIDNSTDGSIIKQWTNSKWNIVYDWKPSIDAVNGKIEVTNNKTSEINSQVTAIDNKYSVEVNQINTSFDTLNATVTGHNSEIETMKESIKTNETNFAKVSLDITGLKANIGSTTETLTTIQNNVSTLDSNTYKKSEVFTKEEVSSTIAATKNEINLSVDGKYETKENSQTIITNAINTAKGYTDSQVTIVSDSLTSTKASIDISLNSISELVSANTESNKTIQTSITGINGSISTINENIKTQSDKIAGTQTSLDGVITRVASTENTSSTLTESFSSLDGKVNGINGNLGTLTNNFNDLNSNVYRKTETLTSSEVETKIAAATDSINLSVSNKYATTTTVTTSISDSLNSAKSYADSKKSEAISSANSYSDTKKTEAINDAKGYTDNQITEINKTITTNQAAIDIFKDSISSKVTATEESISSINGAVTDHTSRLNSAEEKITPTAITNSISESLNNGQTITTTTTITDKNGFTVKHDDGDYTTLSGKGLLRYRSTGDLRGEYHYLFHRGSVSNVVSNTTVRITLPSDFKGLDYGISWWAGNVFPENSSDLIFAANAELVQENKTEGWFEVKASLMVRNPGSESSPNWRGKMNIMYMAIA